MDRFLRTLSIRRKRRPKIPETNGSNHPISWQEDERKVREGTCSFQVQYLGSVEVFESRGIQICEDAIKRLKSQSKHKRQRAILYVSGDALRVVDELSKGLLVDQTIEKVSFCAPDRYHSKGFAYICRDGTTRRWLCHGFLAVKESGERLSHAVGCAFAICLEKKQKREREAVTVQFNEDRTSFTRFGSFRQVSLAERLQDPQAVKPAPATTEATVTEAVGNTSVTASVVAATGNSNSTADSTNGPSKALPPGAVQRPRASAELLERQASFRGFSKLQELVSPFKRHVSLRLTELPSTLERREHDFDQKTQQPSADSPTKHRNDSTSASSKHKWDDAAFGLSNSGFSVPQPNKQAAPQQQTNGANQPSVLWQTPTILEEEEPVTKSAQNDDPFAAAPFSVKARSPASHLQTFGPMHHSLTSGSIADAATPTASASPSIASGLSTPARPLAGFTLLPSSASMTLGGTQPPVLPSSVSLQAQAQLLSQQSNHATSLMMTPIGGSGTMFTGNVMVMPSGNVVVSPIGMPGGTLMMTTPNGMVPVSVAVTNSQPTLLSAAQFADSSVPPSATRAQFAASSTATPLTSGPVDPFDVAWAEKQTTRARMNNPFANSASASNSTRQDEVFKVRL